MAEGKLLLDNAELLAALERALNLLIVSSHFFSTTELCLMNSSVLTVWPHPGQVT
jgi:hypothetical protein